MGTATHFLTLANGKVTGAGFTPDGTLPPGAIVCTAEQALGAPYATVAEGVITIGAPPAPTLAQQAAAALNAGIAITSTGTPALNGTYACDNLTQAKLSRVATFIAVNGKFPAGLTAMPWPDITGAVHEFPTIAEFQALASAVANYVVELDAVIMGLTTTLPSASTTIP